MNSFVNSYKEKKQSLDDILLHFKREDSLAVPLATGQPMALMNALDRKKDWKRLDITCGLLAFPYPILLNKKVFVQSGYYGPIERFLNGQGANMEYLPSNFRGFEYYANKKPTRVIATTVSAPDKDGYLSFGTHGAAVYRPFVDACRNENQIAIAEVNPQMPVVYGLPEYGDNKIHFSEVDYLFEDDYTQAAMPDREPSVIEQKIAKNVMSLIEGGETLQFGIGPVPDLIAQMLTESDLGDFGVHSELISDGFLKLYESGKISNKNKGVFLDKTIFTFAFGTKNLYEFLDERNGRNKRSALCLPVTVVNDPSIICRNPYFTSINSGLMIDFAGQVCSEAIGHHQYSGVGGQLSFVQGAYQAARGKTILCVKSAAQVNGKLVSNIYPQLPAGSIISTPRHFTQYIVTEYGVANLYGVSDEKRGEKLIEIAHPEFRDELSREYEKIRAKYYK